MPTGAQLWVAAGRVHLTIGDEILQRALDEASVTTLRDLAGRYVALVEDPDRTGLLELGRDLLAWLDGDERWWPRLDEVRPLVLEIRGPASPDAAAWAVLRAPWEVLADGAGFLAEDGLRGYAPFRRLGAARPAAAPDDHRLALAFMAASPRGTVELDFEAEEQAIMTAAGDLDLEVEDSGDATELGRRLAGITPAVPVLHLSCHGHNAWPPSGPDKGGMGPVLLMEDAEGAAEPTTAAQLIEALPPDRPRLLFLSACLTAKAAGGEDAVAHSLATGLVRAGLPAVMAWNGSVADVAATAFAALFYQRLARRDSPAAAAATARRALLRGEGPVAGSPERKEAGSAIERLMEASAAALRRDWHLAQLWVGAEGGGPVVGGDRKRSLLGPDHARKRLLKQKATGSEVAAPGMFVGRRRELQDCLKALRDGRHAGVLIHGLGHLGKSSLAARLAGRRGDLALAVLYGRYDAGAVLEALDEALAAHPPARQLLDARRDAVLAEIEHGKAEVLHDLLVDLLTGPCRQRAGGMPLLLLVDDLEQVLEGDPGGGRHRVRAGARPVLAAILRAFAPERSDSRLLLTSRFPFTLGAGGEELADRLWALPIGGLSEAARRKLSLRQVLGARDRGFDAAELSARLALVERAQAAARGHPGLQDLIGQRLVLAPSVTVEQATAALRQIEAYLEDAAEPDSPEVRAYLERLAVDSLLKLAGADGRALLQASLIFDLPVPVAVMDVLAAAVGGGTRRLVDLGLLEPFEDLVRPEVPAVAVNPLARPRVARPDEAGYAVLAAEAVRPLFEAWGGIAGRARRPYEADLLLTRLGLAAGAAEVVAACAADAVKALERRSYREAAELGQAAIEMLDRAGVAPSLHLLSQAAVRIGSIGDSETADRLLARAEAAVEAAVAAGEKPDPGPLSGLLASQANRLMIRGNLDEAEQLFDRAASLAASRGEAGLHDMAAARGLIADIHYKRGQLDEAIRILQHEILPVFNRLGHAKSKAVAMGRIADIYFTRGQLDEALRIRIEEELPVYERLGDARAKAMTLGQIADIHFSRGHLDEALRIRTEEELPVFERLGDVRSKAVTMGYIADIHFARGRLDEALRIRTEEELPVYERLGDVREHTVTMGKVADILQARGQLEEALAINLSRIDTAKALKDIDVLARARFACAVIRLQRGDHQRGGIQAIYEDLQESFDINRHLQRPDGIGVVGLRLAQVLAMGGHRDDALEVLQEARSAFELLKNTSGVASVDRLAKMLRGSEDG